jgi:hypothetical protein
MDKAEAVSKAVDRLLSTHESEVEVIRSKESKESDRKKAVDAIARENKELIVNLVLLDDAKGEERAYLKALTSQALAGALLTVSLAVVTVISIAAGQTLYVYGLVSTFAAFATLVFLIVRYDQAVKRNLEEIVLKGASKR